MAAEKLASVSFQRKTEYVAPLPGGDQLWDVFLARSIDGGQSFLPNVQINDTSFATPNGAWLGEYLGLAVDGDHAYVAWTSSLADASGDVYFDKAPNAQIPEPSTLILFSAGAAALLVVVRPRRRRR